MAVQLGKRILASDDPEVDTRLWLVLTEACATASLSVLPYALTLTHTLIEEAEARNNTAGRSRPPWPVIGLIGFAQSNILFGALSAIGLRLGKPMGLGVPHLRNVLQGKPSGLRGKDAARYAALGVGSTIVIAALDFTVFRSIRKQMKQAGLHEPPPWMGVLATPYGGIAEEVLMRLGLQTMIAAGLRRLTGDKTKPPGAATMWPAIFLSNVAFGAGHLPAASRFMKLTPLGVARVMVLNAVAGTVFGYLYWQESALEASIIAHGSADIVLHVIAPVLDRDQ